VSFRKTLLPAAAFAAALAVISLAPESKAAGTCTFTTSGSTMTLDADCTTDASIVVPNGFTLDGAGYTITAADPVAGHFVGGVIQNGGTTANVTNVGITTSGLADVCDGGAARLRGILFDGASGAITNNTVTNLKQGVTSGCQEGNAIEARNFTSPNALAVVIDQNTIDGYQKTGIVANGRLAATITDNIVDGGPPVGYIARNGIQVGFGATGMVKRNSVSGNSYTGGGDVSGGILVVGGPGYGAGLEFCRNVQVIQNTVEGADVGVYVSQYEADFSAPASATNIKVVNNTLSKASVTNGYVYQAGVSDVGNNDKIITNRISGAGYDPATLPGATFAVDADPSFTNRPKIQANK
jgi:hypothetical protein